ncbi:efflux RND transporter periplasmic adaptor subunit [Falsigemmobacter faecalis]|uniref:Efflux RND transporter periplasmic adaptor subunit n=1 Tax=Falsigemmobacter faecalis TaxID=2488730 RepID=A0A3P3DV11_9RHOB|nr:efflux RND transporter periplasmic adaptor subunit [Falsigemmobacter faecalis]RRH78117.1 efflux RND transporter periplasmic adaptor subunit [Falsigemmobacter faecalis]
MSACRLLFTAVVSCLALALPLAAGAPLTVTTAEVHYDDTGITLELTGLITARDLVTAGFANAGQVLAVYPEAGAEVAVGDLLAEQDPTQAREALRAAEAALAAADAALLREEREIARDRELSRQGYVSQAQLDVAEEALTSARATSAQAASRVDAAQKALAETRLTARVAAVVLSRQAEAGQVVGAAQPVLELAGLEGRDAVFVAPAHYNLTALPGTEVILSTIEPPNRSFTAEVHQVAPMIDSNTGGIRVTLRLPDEAAGQVMLNEPVEGHLPVGIGRAAGIPAQALVRGQGGPAVWVLGADGFASLTPVRVAHYTSDRVFVAEGLSEGARVIVKGAAQLFPGRALQVQDVQE